VPLISMNCGGDACGDFLQDPTEAFAASQCFDATLPVPEIYKTSRFGRHNIGFTFDVTKGEDYEVALHFIEPWYGASRSEQSDYEGYRIFDVAFNKKTVIDDLDIWAQSGFGTPYIRKVSWKADADTLRIHFPEVKAGQAIISAISVLKLNSQQSTVNSPLGSTLKVQQPTVNSQKSTVAQTRDSLFWTNISKDLIAQMPDSLLPPKAAAELQVEPVITVDSLQSKVVLYTYSVGVAKEYALRFSYWNGDAPRTLHVTVQDQNGVIYVDSDVSFLQTQPKKSKRKTTSITTGSQTNAGTYTVTITGDGIQDMVFDKLTIE
ncbi:MAG: hypothetical protein HUK05_09075, partial [Prevotella sp.]|nr:hypothetical protein [Prevotella sp.]